MSNGTFKRQAQFARSLSRQVAKIPLEKRLHLDVPGTGSLAAWFLGPKAENHKLFRDLVNEGLDAHCQDRREYFPGDPPYITQAMMDGSAYRDSVKEMGTQYRKLLAQLKGSVPFFSYRYQAHMNWELTLPGMLGYFAAMLYNQNNVAAEASPITTQLETHVGNDLCEMLRYPVPTGKPPPGTVVPWGHITCDGSVANLEAMWAARNLKYYAVSVAQALKNDPRLAKARGLTVPLLTTGEQVPLVSLDTWALLNLGVDDVLDLSRRLQEEYGIDSATVTSALDPYLLQSLGFEEFSRRYLQGMEAPVVVGTATKHYSWPKGAAILGIGKNNFRNVAVDENARMSLMDLRTKLEDCLAKKTPVLMVVVVLGSTEQSAVDPLVKVLALREEYQRGGLNFAIHVDAAWGGYFASMLKEPKGPVLGAVGGEDTPVLAMSDYVNEQYLALGKADSITIDPHKAGYVPYPAGGLCYRNRALRDMVTFVASEVYHDGGFDATVGIYGIEGSKPGAAAAAVYLSHSIIRPDQSGYGRILGKALFNSKRLYAAVITMAREEDPFVVVPVQQIPAERNGEPPEKIEEQMDFIRARIVPPQNEQLVQDTAAMALLKELGSDQIIITYGFNFKDKSGALNADPELANELNQRIFELLSLEPGADPSRNDVPKTPLIITTSTFDPNDYGQPFVSTYMKRLGLRQIDGVPMKFISSSTMSPWLTATEKGNFIPTLIEAFRKAILKVVEELQAPAVSKRSR